MRFCRTSLRHEGVLGIGRLVVSPVSPMYIYILLELFAKSARYAVDDIGEMISDRDGCLGDRYFLNLTNERTCFASCACTFKSFGLIICLKYTSD